MAITFHGLPTCEVQRIRGAGRDAYGLPVETHVSDGDVWPCRHCLGEVPVGASYLILAHRPFSTINPYAETGPIFLCAEDCAAYVPGREAPAILRAPAYIVRGYSADERIVYGTGKVTPVPEIADYATALLENPDIAFVDVRSAANNCFQCRIHRG